MELVDLAAALTVAVLVALLTVRVTRLIVVDRVLLPVRRWVLKRDGKDGAWTFLIHCPWCVGAWLAIPAAVVAWLAGGLAEVLPAPWWVGVPALWGTYAYLTGAVISKGADS